MKKLLLFLFPLFFNFCFAQTELLPNNTLLGSQLLPCPFDTSVSTYQVPYWQFYQTTNNQWDGPVDSSLCINAFMDIYYQTVIALHDIDTSRFLFCRLELDSAHQIPITKNSVFNAGIMFTPVNAQTGNCGSVPCSQLLLEIDIPDSAGTGRSFRTYSSPITNSGYDNNNPLFCFPSEKFNDQYLMIFIAQIKATGASSDSIFFSGFSVSKLDTLNGIPSPFYLTDSMVAQYNNQLVLTSPPYVNNNFGAGGTLLALYSDTTYPGPNDYSDLRIFPTNPYDSTPQVIDVTMASNFTLMFQPYTDFVPAKVYDHPDTMHTINLMLSGATYCISPFIETIINHGVNFIYRSGYIDFGGPGSCIQFRPTTKLIVDESSTFNYGDEAKPGIMLLRENSEIILSENSTLNMYGTMILNEYNKAAGPGQFFMTLPPSTTLRFMQGSNLITDWSIEGKMKLNVYMKGGILDDSGLPDYAKPGINRIYDSLDLKENLTGIFPNPSEQATNIKVTAAQDEKCTIEIFNIQGQLVYNTALQLQKGINVANINYGNLPGGEYILRMKSSDVFSGKMVVIN